MKRLWLALALLGALLPWWFFTAHLLDAGPAPVAFLQAVFASAAAGGIAADLIVSSLAFWTLLIVRRVPRAWAYVLINLCVGLSCALPLYLYVQARRDGP